MFLPPKEQKSENLNHIPSFSGLRLKGETFSSPEKAEKGGGFMRLLGIGLIIIIILALVFIIWQGISYFGLYSSFKDIETSCQRVQTEFQTKDFPGVSESLNNCQENIYLARQKVLEVNALPVTIFDPATVPLINFLDSLYNLTNDVADLNNYFGEFYFTITDDQEQSNKNVLDFISKDLGEVMVLFAELQEDKLELEKTLAVDNFFLNRIRKKFDKPFQSLSGLESTISQNIPYLELLPSILAYDQEKTYLLLFQNSSELRPTGGFWGSYGILKIKNGKVTQFNVDDIYHLDVNIIGKEGMPVPPEPLAKYLAVNQWYMRDANWSPDFLESAQIAQYFYHLEGGEEKKLDGVMAITPKLVEDFLLYLGPIEVDGLYFDRENFLSLLEHEVEIGFEGRNVSSWNRKEILQPLTEKLINKFQESLSFDTITEITAIFETSLASKDIIMYFNDPGLEANILGYQWAGAIINTEKDYLNIIDANLASYKTDLYIERRVDYNLRYVQNENNEHDLIARLEIEYLHSGNFDWKTTRYRTYTRVYVPKGSELISWQGAMENDRIDIPGQVDVYEELDKTVFGAFISVEPQEGGKLIFEYKLPKRIQNQLKGNNYQLIFQKQPGVENKTINIDLELDKPVNNATINFGNLSVFNNKIIIDNLNLKKDLEINLKF